MTFYIQTNNKISLIRLCAIVTSIWLLFISSFVFCYCNEWNGFLFRYLLLACSIQPICRITHMVKSLLLWYTLSFNNLRLWVWHIWILSTLQYRMKPSIICSNFAFRIHFRSIYILYMWCFVHCVQLLLFIFNLLFSLSLFYSNSLFHWIVIALCRINKIP